jgi:hypothetical protein
MRGLLTAAAALGCVLALSACGSGHRTAFTKFSKVGALLVPTPTGFHARSWPEGVVISNRSGKIPIPCTTMDGCATDIPAGFPSEDELVVYRTAFIETPPALRLPLTLQKLDQVSDGLTEWSTWGMVGRRDAYAVAVWLGPKATAADRSAILSALQTIKPV